MDGQIVCPFCQSLITSDFSFCPACGKQLKEVAPTVGKQISVYLLSVFLPPLGLFPGIRYLMNADPKTKRVGIIAIGLTIIATVLTIWLSVGLFNQINASVNTQMQQLQGIGY